MRAETMKLKTKAVEKISEAKSYSLKGLIEGRDRLPISGIKQYHHRSCRYQKGKKLIWWTALSK